MESIYSDENDGSFIERHFAVDVVCGAIVVEEGNKYRQDHRGTVYSFCSEECQNTFQDYPDVYDEDEI